MQALVIHKAFALLQELPPDATYEETSVTLAGKGNWCSEWVEKHLIDVIQNSFFLFLAFQSYIQLALIEFKQVVFAQFGLNSGLDLKNS